MTDRTVVPAMGWQRDGAYVPCPECGVDRDPHQGPGTPLFTVGMSYHREPCSQVPGAWLSPEAKRRLQERLDEIDACRRRAWANARNYVIGATRG